MNATTLKMYQHTIDQYDCMGGDDICSPESVESFWLDMMEDFSEEYDADWYPLVATDAIRRTINWNFIAQKYNERRSILDKFSDDEDEDEEDDSAPQTFCACCNKPLNIFMTLTHTDNGTLCWPCAQK